MNKKKLVSLFASAVLAVQALAVPLAAHADEYAYAKNSDFSDCAVGGAIGNPIYGLGIIADGGPWLIKGSAGKHYQTLYRDEENNINYCNMYSNSSKAKEGDGAGSMYMYQRDTSGGFTQTYGHCKFDIRMHSGSFELALGSFGDPTSNMNYRANSLVFSANSITAYDGARQVSLASIKPDQWYTVNIVVDNVLQSTSISVTDKKTKKVVGMLEDSSYLQPECNKVCIWCFGYIRGNAYDYDLTDVTIEKTDGKTNPYSIK